MYILVIHTHKKRPKLGCSDTVLLKLFKLLKAHSKWKHSNSFCIVWLLEPIRLPARLRPTHFLNNPILNKLFSVHKFNQHAKSCKRGATEVWNQLLANVHLQNHAKEELPKSETNCGLTYISSPYWMGRDPICVCTWRRVWPAGAALGGEPVKIGQQDWAAVGWDHGEVVAASMAGRGVACGRKPGRCAVTDERRLDLAVRVVVAPLQAVRTGSSGGRQRAAHGARPRPFPFSRTRSSSTRSWFFQVLRG
jgi:hypothetical protein